MKAHLISVTSYGLPAREILILSRSETARRVNLLLAVKKACAGFGPDQASAAKIVGAN